MPRKRADSFKIALDTLRAELRAGAHAAGARLTANEIAERLNLSQTPVREALSRLTGEGLLQDRRGQGFFVPSLADQDLVVLFSLQRDLLQIAAEGERPTLSAGDLAQVWARPSDEPAALASASERLLFALAAGCSRPLSRHLSRLNDQLAAVRTSEHLVLAGLDEELVGLAAAIAEGEAEAVRSALNRFFARRIAVAPTLARLQAGASNIESI